MSNYSTFEEELARHGKIVYTNVGDSMLPLIKQGRDALIIERVTSPLKRGDIPLYKRNSGKYVLHRVVGKNKRGYRILGDNRFRIERGINDSHIIGVLTGIIRDGREMTVREAEGGLYRFYILNLYPVRFLLLGTRELFRRIRRRLKGRKTK